MYAKIKIVKIKDSDNAVHMQETLKYILDWRYNISLKFGLSWRDQQNTYVSWQLMVQT